MAGIKDGVVVVVVGFFFKMIKTLNLMKATDISKKLSAHNKVKET